MLFQLQQIDRRTPLCFAFNVPAQFRCGHRRNQGGTLSKVTNAHAQCRIQPCQIIQSLLAIRFNIPDTRINETPCAVLCIPRSLGRKNPLLQTAALRPTLQLKAVTGIAIDCNAAEVNHRARGNFPVHVLIRNMKIDVHMLHFKIHFPFIGFWKNDVRNHQ